MRSQDIKGNILKARTGRAEDYAHRGIILMLTCRRDLLSPLNSKEMSRRTTGGMNMQEAKGRVVKVLRKTTSKPYPMGEDNAH